MVEVALARCSIHRPRHLTGVEVVVAETGLRSFPAHVSRGLGVCLKFGGAHEVAVEGHRERYPADAVSLRLPGCLWASEAGVHGFVSIDVAPELLPGDQTGRPMGFVGRGALPDVAVAARRMTLAEDALEAEEVLAELLEAVLASDVLSSDATRGGAGPAGAVADACEFLRDRAAERPTLDAAASAASVSKYALLRRFRTALGTTPHAYLVMVRVSRAQALLAAGATPAEAAAGTGFSDQAHLGLWFRRMLGVTPAAYRRQARAAISLQTGSALHKSMPAMTAFLQADPERRTDIRFPSADTKLAGHLYRPPGAAAGARTPGVALCGPISSVKEQTLPHYAERLADAGYTALTFDPRGFGESGGEPRARYDPWAVIEDYHSAVSHLLTREDVDPERVAAVGVCMGAGYAVSLAARDKRLRAVVAVAGGYDIGTTFQRGFGVDEFAAYLRSINDLVQQQYADGEVRYIPTIAHALDEETPIAVMPNDEAYEYYDRTSTQDAPRWPRELTADSLPAYFAYNAVAAAPLVAPIPLMIVHGTKDAALLPEFAQAAYDAAAEPKELVWIDTDNHVQLYDQEPYVPEAARHAIRWLDAHVTA